MSAPVTYQPQPLRLAWGWIAGYFVVLVVLMVVALTDGGCQ